MCGEGERTWRNQRNRRASASDGGRGLIPQAAIRRLARFIAERFQPEKIILFGSYAYGRPDPGSDVDLLVVMPARNEIDQSVRIRNSFEAPFPVDLIVRTPFNLERRLRWGDDFLREIVGRGKVLFAMTPCQAESCSRHQGG
jgi:predicted nucleotidyltransferase